MGHETRAHNEVALELLHVQPRDRVLEIGFGHGRTLRKLVKLAPEGFVAGVDHSPLMVRLARQRYRHFIERGLLAVSEATSARLPYRDADFDHICAVHTIYFWSDPRRDLLEIRRVLRIGGRLVLAFRDKDDAMRTTKYPAAIYRFYDEQELAALARDVGFDKIEFHRRRVGGSELVCLCAA
jgi:ubiquinone/menaquinone biosynthesis C-methylase UbiE